MSEASSSKGEIVLQGEMLLLRSALARRAGTERPRPEVARGHLDPVSRNLAR